MDDLRHGEASLQNDPAKFRDSMVSGVFCSQVVLPFCSPIRFKRAYWHHQIRVVLEIRGILLEM